MRLARLFFSLLLSITGIILTSTEANATSCPGSMIGTGISSDPCQITNATQLQFINSGLTLEYKLMNNIDMQGATWTAIGGPSYLNPFNGTLDGNGFTISNLSGVAPSSAYRGLLINYVGTSGTIKNLEMRNLNYEIQTDSSNYLGGVVGILNGAIVNSSFEGILRVTSVDSMYLGGIAGRGTGAITAVDNRVDIDGGGSTGIVSGFFGLYESGATILASLYTGTISNTNALYSDNAFSNSSVCTFVTYSYYDREAFGAFNSGTCTSKGQTTSSLKSPVAATGIYANWTSFWNFGSSSEYPALTSFLSNPNAPTAVGGVAGDGSVVVSWTAPTNTGGRSVSAYTATASPGGLNCTSSSTTCTVSGLSNGTSYSFAVTATTSFGSSAASSSSAGIIPIAVEQVAVTPIGTEPDTDLPAIKSANVKINKKYSATSIAKLLSISVPKKAAVKVSVSTASKSSKICAKSGAKVSTKKPGTCTVTVTVQPARVGGKKQAAQITNGKLIIQ